MGMEEEKMVLVCNFDIETRTWIHCVYIYIYVCVWIFIINIHIVPIT